MQGSRTQETCKPNNARKESTMTESITFESLAASVEAELTTINTEAVKTIAPEHRPYFADRAIDLELAQAYSATSVDDLPEGLQIHAKKHGEGILPGIVFEHLDIRGNITHQLRPDNEGTWGKYLFEAGAMNGPYIHRTQAHLVGKTRKVAAIEGTAQFRAAITAATADGSIEDTLFVGLPGCGGSWQNQHFSHDWNDIIQDRNLDDPKDKGVDVVLAFDADVATNHNVWTSADKLRRHLEMVSAAKVRIANLPAYNKQGLDDWLAQQPANRRSRSLAGLLREATAKMIKRPSVLAGRKAADAELPNMDFMTGITAMPPQEIGGMKVPGRKVMEAAARIARTYYTHNDLAPDLPPYVTYDLEVFTSITGTLRSFIIKGLTDAELENPKIWLRRLPGGIGGNIGFYIKDLEKIVLKIREVSTQELVNVMERTGLITDEEGIVRYMHAEGAIGPEDTIDTLLAKPGEKRMAGVTFPDPHSLDAETVRAAYRHALAMWDILETPTAFLLVLGQTVASVSGLVPLGTYGSYGAPGSGKTTVFNMNMSFMGSKASLANFESTVGVIGQLGAGLENSCLYVDDFQDLTAGRPDARERKNDALNMLLRRGYGGAGYSKDRLSQNRDTGRYEVAEADPASPFFSVTMEHNAIPYEMKSSMERLMLAEVTRSNSFRSSADAHRAMEMSASPLANIAMADIIGRLVRDINGIDTAYETTDKLATWKTVVDERRRGTQEALQVAYPEAATEARSYELAATPVYGIQELLQNAHDAGVLTYEEMQARAEQARTLIMGAVNAWQTKVLARGRGTEDHLSKLHDAVLSGSYTIEATYREAATAASHNGTKVLGWYHNYRGQNVVVINPTEAAKVCGLASNPTRLENELAEHLVLDQAGNKKPSVPAGRDSKVRKRLWCLKLEVWQGLSEDFDAKDAELAGDDANY